MKSFNELCKIAEALNPVEYAALVTEKSLKILPALGEVTGSVAETAGLFASFLMASIYADGKIDETEYALMLPMLKLLFGSEFDYDAAKALARTLRPEGKALKKAVEDIVKVIGEVDEELKNDIVLVSLLICAVDGKITLKEKNYIKQLII